MSSFVLNLIKNIAQRHFFKKTINEISMSSKKQTTVRNYADIKKTEASTSKAVVRVRGPESEVRLRVRRSRPADVPRVLRFVRENMRVMWPSFCSPPGVSHLVLCDYVARALCQGHTMLAEQVETRRGMASIRGVAIGSSTCPWDATILEKYAQCIRCSRSRRFVDFTAHCLRLPALYDKYGVRNILQVILIVPPNSPKCNEIIQMLARNAIQRGTDVGFQLLRFDVTNNDVGKSLEAINLKKECESVYEVTELGKSRNTERGTAKEEGTHAQSTPVTSETSIPNYFAVYSVFTKHATVK